MLSRIKKKVEERRLTGGKTVKFHEELPTRSPAKLQCSPDKPPRSPDKSGSTEGDILNAAHYTSDGTTPKGVSPPEECQELNSSLENRLNAKSYSRNSAACGKGEERCKSGMEVGVASYTSGRQVGGSPDRGRGPQRANLHVEFAQLGEVKERKEKYLTAKYGAHQMSLIRKRLGVEMWMFDQLQSLYPTPEGKHEEKELDLDELLDIEGELKRKKFLWDSLADCKQSKDKVEKFIGELLERATTL